MKPYVETLTCAQYNVGVHGVVSFRMPFIFWEPFFFLPVFLEQDHVVAVKDVFPTVDVNNPSCCCY